MKKKRRVKYIHLIDGKSAMYYPDVRRIFPRHSRFVLETADSLRTIRHQQRVDHVSRVELYGDDLEHFPEIEYGYAKVYVD